MESSAEKLFGNMELLYENIYNLLTAFQEASLSQSSSVSVTIKKADGTFETVTINSFQKVLQELSRLDANYKSLLNGDNLSYVLDSDGSISQLTKTSFVNAEYLENFTFEQGENCVIDKTSHIDDLVFPNVKIPITINSRLLSDVYCKTFEISEGWENIGDNPTILDLQYLYSIGKIIYKEINRSLKLEKEHIKYFGKFTVESLTIVTPNIYNIILNSVKYTGLNVIGNSIDLKIGDIFVSKSGASKYIINELDKVTKTLRVSRIAGSEILTTGIDNLYFNEILPTEKKIVGIPVRPVQKIVVFLSTENFKNISYPSVGIKIDTSTYKIIFENKSYALDEFFSTFVLNFSEYLIAFINETSIPLNLGIIPNKPVLDITNFKVVQINKHLNNAKSLTEIDELNKRKQFVQNDIDFKQTLIDKNQNEIDTQKFNSVVEKTAKLEQITLLRQDLIALKTNLLEIAKDIDTNAIKYGLKTINPKYKIIAFWSIQTPSYSPLTKPQNIIKYEVNYRYLSKDIDTIENTSYSMIDENGKSISVVFSPWNELPTKSLNKIKNLDGTYSWQTQILDSVEEININQLAISINESESVEIKVRAISEAGYPIAPLKSEWSEIIRIDFPNELKQSNVKSTISQNNIDLNKAEFEQILQSYGLLGHVAGVIRESEKTFLHKASDIASGQYTAEQKNIPVDVVISTLLKEVAALKAGNEINNVVVNLVDFSNESFVVKNNTTMDLFGGNYSDNFNLLDATKWGSIIRKKGYIKIQNNNAVPIELKTLVPGVMFNPITAPSYYNILLKNVNSLSQDSKQILYFRNVDLTGQSSDAFKLVSQKLSNSITYPDPNDLNDLAPTNEKNILFRDLNGNISIGKLKSNYSTDFVSFTTEHPLYNKPEMHSEFDRLKLYTPIAKALQYQNEIDSVLNENLLGFGDNDFYAVGQNTCGAFLYPIITNKSTISVIGDTTIATLIIPKNSEILVPFVFEYRMIDRIGNINGLLNQDANTVLSYSKKIGIDMMINNELFKFDINVSCKLKSKITTASSINISSVIGANNNENISNIS